MQTINIIKQNNKFYLIDNNGFSKEENELVSGVPEIIKLFSNKDIITIQHNNTTFPNAKQLHLIHNNKHGATYKLYHNNKTYEGWFCKVFFYYYDNPPNILYFNII